MWQCKHCASTQSSQPWISFFKSEEENGDFCCYLCWNRYPKYIYWKYVTNKEDFKDYMLHPIVKQKEKDPDFFILTDEEICNLSSKNYEDYMDRLDDFKTFYPERYEIMCEVNRSYENDEIYENDDDDEIDFIDYEDKFYD